MVDTASAESEYQVEIMTLQPNNIKAAFAVLKEQLSEANLSIRLDGIHLLQMDSTHIVVAQMFLKAENFEKYVCKKPIDIGIDVMNFTKILKGVGANEILTIFVKSFEDQTGGDQNEAHQNFGLKMENTEKGQISYAYIDPLDVNEEEINEPDLNYPYTIRLPSADLQSIFNQHKIMSGEVIQLRYHHSRDLLSSISKGELGRLETVRSRTINEDSSMRVKKDDSVDNGDDIIEMYVKLAKLVEFAKCSSLSPIATIYLKNNNPLFLEYDVGSLGWIRLGISQQIRPDNF